VIDYLCAKLGSFGFSRFSFNVRTESHTEAAVDRYTHATTVTTVGYFTFSVGIDFRFWYDVMSDDVARAGDVVTEKFYRVVPVLHVCRSADDVDSCGNRIEECRTRF